MGYRKSKVFVAISGGVDSSVAAALLKDEGYDVTGVFIKVWQPNFLPCSFLEERIDAMRVAAHLNIPFITLDLEKEYKRDVVDYMVREYRAGRTPNPDVFCNKYIKFGAFFDYARENGADYIATGHYVRLGQITLNSEPHTTLLKGIDENKDQSYFLWTLTERQLERVLFPIGDYEKSMVRALAQKYGLPTAQKKDSQGLCFVGKVNMREFLTHFIETTCGNVLNERGKCIGVHSGAELYTVGQRHGFTVTARNSNVLPLYILEKSVKHNTLVVSEHPERVKTYFSKKRVLLTEVNWIAEIPVGERRYQGRFRYRQPLQPCFLRESIKGETIIEFENEQAFVPEGQSFVLYDGEICLGGGVVEHVQK